MSNQCACAALCILLAGVANASAASAEEKRSTAVPVVGGEPGRQDTTWDLDVSGGYGRHFGDVDKFGFVGRARAGILRIQQPRMYALGAAVRLSSELPLGVGIEAEYLNTESGLWFTPGLFLDTKAQPGGSLTAGLSVLGLTAELRRRPGGEATFGVFASLRIPIGVIVWAASSP